jgi:xanthine dehydrogenase accessory factor
MIFDKASELKSNGTSFVMVTLLEVRGSAPQDPGAKCLVTDKGLYAGTIGGGKVEAAGIEFAQNIIKENVRNFVPKTITWNLQKDIGMTCGGECVFLFEYFPATRWPIVIFGAGHVSQALTRTLANLDCQITCIDPRGEWTDKLEKFSNLKIVTHEDPKSLVKDLPSDAYYISMTKGHAFDTPILTEIFKYHPNAPYVGVIGSKVKGDKIKAELAEAGIESAQIEKLRVPIGLPLGENYPFEISISIAAELLQVRDQNKS